MLPRKKLEIWALQTAGNALKLLILPSPCYFCIILNILHHIRRTFLAPGEGGAYAPRAPPCQRACI